MDFKTARGIKLLDTFKKVKQKYGTAKKMKVKSSDRLYASPSKQLNGKYRYFVMWVYDKDYKTKTAPDMIYFRFQ